MKSIIFATAATVLAGGSAMAAPYVESTTNGGLYGTDYSGVWTEVRVGNTWKVGTGSVYAEIGPGYIWEDQGGDQTTASVELGFQVPLSEKVSLRAKYEGNYLTDADVLDNSGELKVRYTF